MVDGKKKQLKQKTAPQVSFFSFFVTLQKCVTLFFSFILLTLKKCDIVYFF